VTGSPSGIAEIVNAARLPANTQVDGPVPVDANTERLLLRVPRGSGQELAQALKAAAALRSARRSADPVRIALDPIAIV
jgi:primosomal protein N' (replication factor Y)